MRPICFVVILACAAAALPASAQVTIVQGESLSGLIRKLYGGDGITLDASAGHDAHFGDTLSLQEFTDVLQRSLQSRSVFPIPSAAGIFSYHFDEETATYQRVDSTLGPLLADRATTGGKGNVTLSIGYTFADFSLVDGREQIELTLEHCKTFDCVGDQPDHPVFQDVIKVDMTLRLKSQAVWTSVIYGLTDRIDVGLLVPYLRNDLTVMTDARIERHPDSSPNVHKFDPLRETPGQFGTAHAIGLGDMVVRAKYRFADLPFDLAVLGDAVLPTGDRENFLGTGEARIRAMLLASRTGTRFSPHFNLGVDINTGDEDLSSVEYRLGSEWGVTPRFTLVGDLLGTVRPALGDSFTAAALETQDLIGRSEIDFALGGKWKVRDNSVLLFNFLHPANGAGLRPETSVTFGIQMALQ
ncbi:MAG TPA: transporter [Thermoanaerobaculia bacterium]|nr:transporter [Thermoanaerobaculia bacterium]